MFTSIPVELAGICFSKKYNTIAPTSVLAVDKRKIDKLILNWYILIEYYYKNRQRNAGTMSELPEKQVKRLHSLLQEAEVNLAAARELLISVAGDELQSLSPRTTTGDAPVGKVIEGVFDGQKFIDADGKEYPVPVNYASKSKLVEGDILKLTIADDGRFIYKQINQIERKQIIGTLTQHDGTYYVEAGGKEYRILLASVTYFKLLEGSQVTIIVPSDNPDATWAAVEAAL